MKYKGLSKDAEVDEKSSLLQATFALDAAGEVAERTNDVEGLLNVAAMWMKVGEAVGQFAPVVPLGKEGLSVTTIPTGFQRSDIIIEEDDENE
jgi:hypothetical protein